MEFFCAGETHRQTYLSIVMIGMNVWKNFPQKNLGKFSDAGCIAAKVRI